MLPTEMMKLAQHIIRTKSAEFDLRSCQPIARTTTFFIYDFREAENGMAHVGAAP